MEYLRQFLIHYWLHISVAVALTVSLPKIVALLHRRREVIVHDEDGTAMPNIPLVDVKSGDLLAVTDMDGLAEIEHGMRHVYLRFSEHERLEVKNVKPDVWGPTVWLPERGRIVIVARHSVKR